MKYKSFFLILIFSFLSSPVSANLKEQFNKKTTRDESCKRLYNYAQYEVNDSDFRYFIASDTKKVFLILGQGPTCGISQVGILDKNAKYENKPHLINIFGGAIDKTENCFISTYYEIENGDLIEYKSDKCSLMRREGIIKTRYSSIK